jgi:hypothetical protein
MGLHLYTWALLIFLAEVLTTGLLFTFAHDLEGHAVTFGRVSRFTLLAFGAVIVGNIVAVFFEEGLRWTLPDAPVRYQLLYDLGLRSAK